MKSERSDKAVDRRNFLKTLGAAPVAAAAGLPLAATQARAYDPGAEEMRARYQETDHVRAFYVTNGYETLRK